MPDDPYGKKMGRLSSIPTNDHSALERLRISVVAVQMIAHHIPQNQCKDLVLIRTLVSEDAECQTNSIVV